LLDLNKKICLGRFFEELGTVVDFVTSVVFSGDPFPGILVQLSQCVQLRLGTSAH